MARARVPVPEYGTVNRLVLTKRRQEEGVDGGTESTVVLGPEKTLRRAEARVSTCESQSSTIIGHHHHRDLPPPSHQPSSAALISRRRAANPLLHVPIDSPEEVGETRRRIHSEFHGRDPITNRRKERRHVTSREFNSALPLVRVWFVYLCACAKKPCRHPARRPEGDARARTW